MTSPYFESVSGEKWNPAATMLLISFNKDKVTSAKIHKTIVNEEFATEKETAPDEVYNNLPGCC